MRSVLATVTTKTPETAAIRLPDEMDFRCAGYFVKAVGNEATVSIRYCGDAFVLPGNMLEDAKRNAEPVHQQQTPLHH